MTTNLCFQGLVTANSPGAVATPVSGSLVAFVAFSLMMKMMMQMMMMLKSVSGSGPKSLVSFVVFSLIIHIYGDIDYGGTDEDTDGNDDGDHGDHGDDGDDVDDL